MRIYLSDYALDFIEDCMSYPHLTLELDATNEMDIIVDNIRIKEGLPPLFDNNFEICLNDGWYDFYADINLETEEVECVYVEVFCQDERYNQWKGEVPVDKADVMAQIEKQLRKDYDTTLAKLREELREEEQ